MASKLILLIALLAFNACSYTQEQINKNPDWFGATKDPSPPFHAVGTVAADTAYWNLAARPVAPQSTTTVCTPFNGGLACRAQ